MDYRPEVYHERAIRDIIANPARGVFADPGSGKTGLVLEAFRRLRDAFDVSRALVVAPLAVATVTWPAEVAKWNQFRDLRVCLLQGKDRAERLRADADLYLVNFENLPWLEAQRGFDWPEMLVVDESTRIKSLGQRWYALKRQCWRGERVAIPDGKARIILHERTFARRLILTGTPAPNGLLDLWAQVFLLDGGRALGQTLGAYQKREFVPVPSEAGYMKWVPRIGGEDAIAKALRPLITRISREEIALGLDDPRVVVRPVELPPKARRMYEELRDDCVIELPDGRRIIAPTAASLQGKLRQIANGRVYHSAPEGVELRPGDKTFEVIHNAKLDELESIVEELAGKPAVVVYEFRHDLAAIKSRFPDVAVIGSGVKGAELVSIVERWNRGEIRLLALHPMSGGHGLNLQHGGHSIIWYGLQWDLELYQQAVARLWRRGQQNSVVVYHIVANRTVECRVSRELGRKDATQQALLDALAAELTGALNAIEL